MEINIINKDNLRWFKCDEKMKQEIKTKKKFK